MRNGLRSQGEIWREGERKPTEKEILTAFSVQLAKVNFEKKQNTELLPLSFLR